MKRKLKGKVISEKMEKTATIEIVRYRKHPLYHKKYQITKKYLAENEKGAKEGDFVEISETKPVSKNKRWKIEKIISEKEID